MIRLLEFHRSPNCAKVRIALNYKGIPFEMQEVSANDRTPMIEAAGWPLVPILLDGKVAMRDSEAIIHYLESNYKDMPSLTPASKEEIQRGEALRDSVQGQLRTTFKRLYGQALKSPDQRDLTKLAGLEGELRRALEPLEQALEGRHFVVGERMSMYDVILACQLMPVRARRDYAAQSPMWAFFLEHVSLPGGLPNVSDWLDRVLAYDEAQAGAAA